MEWFRWVKRALKDRSTKPLTDKMMKDMVPIFVDSEDPSDHKCGVCSMRVPMEGEYGCTIIEGPIKLELGTCRWWAHGDEAAADMIHETRMDKMRAGYIEAPAADFPINCSTCQELDVEYCKLWNGNVTPGQCCMEYDSPEVKWEWEENTPPSPTGE